MTPVKCPACVEMKTNANRKHTTLELEHYHPQQAEFAKAMQGVKFTRTPNPVLEREMHDPLATVDQRVWAWILRYSAGNNCLYCVKEMDGEPAYQTDCAAELWPGKNSKGKQRGKQRVSAVVAYREKRGYLRTEGRKLYIIPKPHPPEVPPQKVTDSPDFLTFVTQWKVAHSTDFDELESARATAKVAHSTVKRIERVILSEYRKYRASETKTGAYKESNSQTSSVGSDTAASSSSSPLAPPNKEEEEGAANPIAPIIEAFKGIAGFTDAKARRLMKDCGGATPQEIATKAREELAAIAGNKAVRDPALLVISRLREFFHGPAGLDQWRREREEKAAADTQANRRAEEYQRERQAELARIEALPPEDPEEVQREALERMGRKMKGGG